MEYKHKSGATKRTEKKLKDVNEKKGQQTLEQFRFRLHETDGEEHTTISPSHFLGSNGDNVESNVATAQPRLDIERDLAQPVLQNHKPGEHDGHQNRRAGKVSTEKLNTFDIGSIDSVQLKCSPIAEAVRQGPQPHPLQFPDDACGHRFPENILCTSLMNGEKVKRDWLVWSKSKEALFCFPCRLFTKMSESTRSALAQSSGYSKGKNWKKLHDKIPEHENSQQHKACYVQWRQSEVRNQTGASVDILLLESIKSEAGRWRQILHRILNVVLFLGERGLAFRGSNTLIGDPKNERVKESQANKKRLQVHYLSPETQNEFIDCCATQVVRAIEKERESVKYYSILVDATPDSAHVEQTVFILRYVLRNEESGKWEIQERFLEFVDCNDKTGEAIAELIRSTLQKHSIPLADCRGQGYDNGSNMSGRYKGAQSHILRENSLATFAPCGCHSLNLCGVHAAECCAEVITFFGVIQKLYNCFSASPQRWSILQENIDCSLHSMSKTCWSARVDSVKPFAAHMPGLIQAITQIKLLNLSAETRIDLQGIETYMKTFECTLLASIWLKVLTAINHRNLVIQARDATLDVETKNTSSLVDELKVLRDQWSLILQECKIVAANGGILDTFAEKRRKTRKRQFDESHAGVTESDPETEFKQGIFYVLLDCLIGNMMRRFEAIKDLETKFSFLWKYPELTAEDLRDQALAFCEVYHIDVSTDLLDEIIHLKAIHEANLEGESLPPLRLLNQLYKLRKEVLFPNICIALRIFCTIPVSVAEGERSFSLLSRVKNFLRSTMCQSRLTSLGTLALESGLARSINFESVISMFADQKARKVFFD